MILCKKVELITSIFNLLPSFFISSRKGLSKGSADRGLQRKNEDSLPAPFTKSVQEAISNYTLYELTSGITLI